MSPSPLCFLEPLLGAEIGAQVFYLVAESLSAVWLPNSGLGSRLGHALRGHFVADSCPRARRFDAVVVPGQFAWRVPGPDRIGVMGSVTRAQRPVIEVLVQRHGYTRVIKIGFLLASLLPLATRFKGTHPGYIRRVSRA